MTALLIYALFIHGGLDLGELFRRPDGVYPRPVVEVLIEFADGSTRGFREKQTLIEGCVKRSFKLKVKLINDSDEPSVERDMAAGILLVFDGARVDGYDLKGFENIMGVTMGGEIIDAEGARIVEIFSSHIGSGDVKEAYLELIADEEAEEIKISFRGWIMDEDDRVVEPVSGSKEPYYARYPRENLDDNPPDSRWAGRDFLRYRRYEIIVPVCG